MRAWICSDSGRRGMSAQAGALCALWLDENKLPDVLVGHGNGALLLTYFITALIRAYDTTIDGFDAYVANDASDDSIATPRSPSSHPPPLSLHSKSQPSVWWIAAHINHRGKRAHIATFLRLVETFVTANDMSHDMLLHRAKRPLRWLCLTWEVERRAWWRASGGLDLSCSTKRLLSRHSHDPVFVACVSPNTHAPLSGAPWLDATTHNCIVWKTEAGQQSAHQSLVDTHATIGDWLGVVPNNNNKKSNQGGDSDNDVYTRFYTTCDRVRDCVGALCTYVVAFVMWFVRTLRTNQNQVQHYQRRAMLSPHSSPMSEVVAVAATAVAADSRSASRDTCAPLPSFDTEPALEMALKKRSTSVHWTLLDAITWNTHGVDEAPLRAAYAPDFSPLRPVFRLHHWTLKHKPTNSQLQHDMTSVCHDTHKSNTCGAPPITHDTFHTCVNWGMISFWQGDMHSLYTDTSSASSSSSSSPSSASPQRSLAFKHAKFDDAMHV